MTTILAIESGYEGATAVVASNRLPGWAWGFGGLVLGALLMALMRGRRSEATA